MDNTFIDRLNQAIKDRNKTSVGNVIVQLYESGLYPKPFVVDGALKWGIERLGDGRPIEVDDNMLGKCISNIFDADEKFGTDLNCVLENTENHIDSKTLQDRLAQMTI